MSGGLRFSDACEADMERLVRPLVAARVFPDVASAWDAWRGAPWRFQATPGGDLAVLEPWREHLPILWARALWCPERALPDAARQLLALACEHGFAEILSPLVRLEQARGFERAGMRVCEVIETFVLDRVPGAMRAVTTPADVTIKEATRADADAVLAIEDSCFEPFWRYDRPHVEQYLSTLRLALAVGPEGPVGYSMAGAEGEEGTLGRLAVVPERRRTGIATALAAEALGFLADAGARCVTLSTQRDNEAARALYGRLGFRPTGNRYAFLRY